MSQPKFTALITVRENCGYYLPRRHFLTIGRDHTPLYDRMIGKLSAIERVEHIVVNTDSANVASGYSHRRGFTVVNTLPKRQEELEPFDFEMSPDSVTASILEKIKGEHFLQIGSIFPFLKQSTIEGAIDTYYRYVLDPENGRDDSLFTISAYNRRMYDSDNGTVRTERPNTYVEDGILHLFNRETFLRNGKSKVGKSPFGYSIEAYENLAIESEENHRLAELIAENAHLFPSISR